jgi:endonuclease/exonuclease/phosphatase family metal-dependent hydrolase
MVDLPLDKSSSVLVPGASRRLLLGGLLGAALSGVTGWSEAREAESRRRKRRNVRKERRGSRSHKEKPGQPGGSSGALKVLTRNLYFGTDLRPVFVVDSEEKLVATVTEIFAMVRASNFPERAEALAEEIASIDPHLVGLQEVALWQSQRPVGPSPAPDPWTIEYDFLTILLDALANRGKHYEAAATVQNVDAAAPGMSPSGLEYIRFIDRDVILARTDLPSKNFAISNPRWGNYANPLTLTNKVLGSIPIPRGWVSVDATMKGRTVRVVNTHLEPLAPVIQDAQCAELLAGPLDAQVPVVLLGDLNTVSDSSGAVPVELATETYNNLLAAGFVDASRKDSAFTCCQDVDLANATSALSLRIDYVLTRGGIRVSSTNRVGHQPGDRTPTGLWPSDHAGVWAVLHLTGS